MRWIVLIALIAVIGGCGSCSADERRGGSGSSQPGEGSASSSSGSRAAAGAPDPATPLPRTSSGFAGALADTTRDLEADIRGWLGTKPGIAARPPEAIALEALFQQRIYRHLRRHPALAARAIAALPARLRLQARDNVAAGRSLLRLAPRKRPKTQPPIRVGTAEPPGRLLAWYRQAQRRFGVRWQILAAVNFVESGFNRLRNNSYAGAQGPMQFIASTWRAYGLDGNVRDPHDAIMGAANFLHASGAPGNYRRALYAYNPSPLYVDAIIRYARQMQRKPERFYAYWSWQVFVRGANGEDKRLTGPGLSA